MSNMQNKNDKNFGEKSVEFVKESIKTTFKYFWSKTLASIILGLIAWGFLLLIGVERAGVIGFIAGLFNLVPFAGGLIACIIGGIIAIFQSPLSALYVVLTILVLQQLDQWILTPLIVGKSVQLPAILIIVALIAGSALWGPVGIIVAVPIAGMIRAFYMIFIKSDKNDEEHIESETIDINDPDNPDE